MSNFIGCVLCGVLNLLLLRKLIYVVNLNDKDIILPEKIKNKEYFFMFLCGAVSFHGFCMDTIIFFLLSVYLSFMSYTDYYTRKVYSAFSYFIFLIGIKWKKTSDFHKLTDKQKLEELFKKMNEKMYDEKMIVMIRECIALGVSFEFLYTLIEMDAGAEEFEKLILFRSTENHVTERVENSKKKEIKKEKNELEQQEVYDEEVYYENIPEMEYMGGDVWNGVE